MPKLQPSDLSSEQLAASSIWQARIALIIVIGTALVLSWFSTNPVARAVYLSVAGLSWIVMSEIRHLFLSQFMLIRGALTAIPSRARPA